jgi:hypothetical protein
VAILVVMLILGWPTTELFSEEEVARADPAESHIQLLAVELGSDARIRVRPHVHDELDSLGPQELDEPLERMARVTDRPDDRRRLHDLRLPSVADAARAKLSRLPLFRL